MRIIGLKPWHWVALALLGVAIGGGAESTAEFYGSVLGSLLLGVAVSYLIRGVRNRLSTSGEAETST